MAFRAFLFICFQLLVATSLAVQSGLVSTLPAVREPACDKWESIPLDSNHWQTAYDGYGRVAFKDGIQLAPAATSSVDKTHAALVLMNQQMASEEFGIKVKYQNKRALRTPASNPWEVFWLFFNYQPQAGDTKNTNYLVFKPNGIELGKASGSVDQQFLATADSPQAEFGKDYELAVYREHGQVKAFVNGSAAMDFKASSEKKLVDENGTIGLYTEDAAVQIKSVQVCALPHGH